MNRDRRLEQLEQALGPETITVRVLRVPAHRWQAEPSLSAAERLTFTARVLGPFGVAR
jgi:hypothetical protein